ncbi:TIGR01777 family oxidoreductase [Antrihabitans sp. YC2-6]|uniref:TIGR01777 family oxidoreductase n=1 Tax=Antrihabitans sp. YC2-6 TaxID=2799498 RepID=UPI0018F62D8D|nr:TIGR01777 family oxidoreductase [Antrihabitans sp. YC2-6]MBJ8344897.1 TIGR01777 family oxidoreductase [Antrihabitans sp. YC2-6]
MKIAIAGSSGLIGTALVAALRHDRHDVVRLVRRPPAGADEYQWDPAQAIIDPIALRGADAVVNLCGMGVNEKRWTGAVKQQLRDSRITPTDVLANEVAALGVPILLNASGAGYYGDTGDRIVDERSPAGSGFLPTLCCDWEAATAPAQAAGARTVLLRSASVLTRRGGMLSQLRLLYSVGLGGRLGSGRQYVPWISFADEIDAIKFVLANDSISGPVNLVGPAPVTNAQFNRAMSKAMHRPAPLIVPRFLLSAALGEIAQELLHGPRVIPAALEAAGFEFSHNTIGEALEAANR